MKLIIQFPNPNRGKSYTSNKRRYTLWVNDVESIVVDQDSIRHGEFNVNTGDEIYVDKRFNYRNADSSFRYIVGAPTATLINQKGQEKTVLVDISDGFLFILDDLDFKMAMHVG